MHIICPQFRRTGSTLRSFMLYSARDWTGAVIAEILCWMKGAERGYALFRNTSNWSEDKVRNIWVNTEIELQWKTECPGTTAKTMVRSKGRNQKTIEFPQQRLKGRVIVTGASQNVFRDVLVGGVEIHVFVRPIQLINCNVAWTLMTLDVEQEAKNGELLDGGAACECGLLFRKAPSKWRSATNNCQTGEKKSQGLLLPPAPGSLIAGNLSKDAQWALLDDSRILWRGGGVGRKGSGDAEVWLPSLPSDVMLSRRIALCFPKTMFMEGARSEPVRGSHVRRHRVRNIQRINKGGSEGNGEG
ncbi:hypothetical protein C8R44DRAFT_730405 [Mycena epipterygia]|nr:hypothetical protein C8R44DRAFT_730405 [Mycena epipterygia]